MGRHGFRPATTLPGLVAHGYDESCVSSRLQPAISSEAYCACGAASEGASALPASPIAAVSSSSSSSSLPGTASTKMTPPSIETSSPPFMSYSSPFSSSTVQPAAQGGSTAICGSTTSSVLSLPALTVTV